MQALGGNVCWGKQGLAGSFLGVLTASWPNPGNQRSSIPDREKFFSASASNKRTCVEHPVDTTAVLQEARYPAYELTSDISSVNWPASISNTIFSNSTKAASKLSGCENLTGSVSFVMISRAAGTHDPTGNCKNNAISGFRSIKSTKLSTYGTFS